MEHTLRRLITFWRDYAKRYSLLYALGILCLVATNTLTVAIPRFVQAAVDALDEGLGSDGALPWAFAVLGAGLGIIVVRTLSRTLFFNPGRAIEFRIKSDLFDKLLALPQAFFDRMPPGDIISRGTNDANGVRGLVGFATLQLFNVVFTTTLTVGQMLITNVTLTLWCVGPLTVAAFVLRYATINMFRLHGEQLKQVAKLSDRILESYGGATVLQSFDAVPGAMARFDAENEYNLELGLKLLAIRSWLLPVVTVTGNLCVVLVLYFGGRMVVAGDGLTLGQLTAFIVYINILVAGVMSFGWLVGAFQRGYLSLGRMYEVLDAPVERAEPSAPMPPARPEGHGIEVTGLTFQHPTADRPALRDVSFAVAPGETLGIFGLTGAGKTALLDVLARVYDPPPGTVTVSGTDICAVPTTDYWRQVAHVSQRPFLFSNTVAQNIALGAPDPQPEHLQAALADAALDSDVRSFPDGLDTTVGERGITVSGGQRQRTALARAFYRTDFEILLLDDVMSAVDHATEERLIETLYRRASDKTTLVVSHRISVLAKADRVIVLDEGRLVDQGRHGDLLSRPGPYQKAWQLQQAEEALEGADVA